MPVGMEEAAANYVDAHPECKLSDIVDNAIKPLFAQDKIVRVAAAGYQVVERLLASNRIRHETRYLPGIDASDQVPQKGFFKAH